MINVAVVEDNDNIREGLRILIDGTEGFSCRSVYPDCEALLKNIDSISPDVLLIDIGLPGMNGIEGIKRIGSIKPDLIILVLTVYEENDLIFDALCAGASGFIAKKTPPSKLLESIYEAYRGSTLMNSNIARKVLGLFQQKKQVNSIDDQTQLSPDENEVLNKIIEGNSFKAIATALNFDTETLRMHFRNIYKKIHLISWQRV